MRYNFFFQGKVIRILFENTIMIFVHESVIFHYFVHKFIVFNNPKRFWNNVPLNSFSCTSFRNSIFEITLFCSDLWTIVHLHWYAVKRKRQVVASFCSKDEKKSWFSFWVILVSALCHFKTLKKNLTSSFLFGLNSSVCIVYLCHLKKQLFSQKKQKYGEYFHEFFNLLDCSAKKNQYSMWLVKNSLNFEFVFRENMWWAA